MNSLAILLLTLFAFSSVSFAAEWKLAWQDDFDGSSLNESAWSYDIGCGGFDLTESECYTAKKKENVRLEKGHLVLEARAEELEKYHFSSGRIRTLNSWTYGKFEARAQLSAGQSLWPSIRLLPNASKFGAWPASGEIAIVEESGEKVKEIMGAIQFGGAGSAAVFKSSGAKTFPENFSATFNNFSVEWEPKEIRWSLNDKVFHTENIEKLAWSGTGPNPYLKTGEPFDQPFYLELSLAVGGKFFGKGPYVTPDEAKKWTKHTVEIDYVKVYEKK